MRQTTRGIVEYLHSTNLGKPANSNDETFWCSAFVNWCTEKGGYEGTDSAWALDWAGWGKKAAPPRRGCIVVFRRDEGGHVGFYISETATHIKILGGNQNDSVSYGDSPKNRLVSIREPL